MSNGLQLTLTFKKSMWNTPMEYKDLSSYKEPVIPRRKWEMSLYTVSKGPPYHNLQQSNSLKPYYPGPTRNS